MTYTLYTTYLSNIKKIKESSSIAIVMRFVPSGFKDNEKYLIVDCLSPEPSLLKKYKEDNDFESFKENFLEYLNTNEESIKWMNDIEDALYFNDVTIVCCEKDDSICHRSIIAEQMRIRGFKTQEL